MKPVFTLIKNYGHHLLFAVIFISAGVSSYAATNHIVASSNYVFTPDSFNAVVGDTVTWHFTGGVEHDPKSVTIPNGAATWEHIISPASQDFSYVITVAGEYDYECKFHVDSGMVGKFIATGGGVSGITRLEEDRPLKVYPIPFQQNLTIDLNRNGSFKNDVTIEISNTIGQRKLYLASSEILSAPLTVDLSDLSPGVYFLSVSEGVTKKTVRLIKSE